MKFKVSTDKANDENILYLLVLKIDDQDVYKIGITTRKIEDRVCEILTSHFGIYRYFPYCKPKRFRKVDNHYEKEQELLKYFSEYKYESYNKFGGSTELISNIDLQFVVDTFEKVYKGTPLEYQEWDKCPVCGKDKKFEENSVLMCGTKCEKK